MATLMEKDALLNGVSQCIAFLSNIVDNYVNLQNQKPGDTLTQLVSYRDYLYSTPSELVDFVQGKLRLQQVRTQYQREFNNTEHSKNKASFNSLWQRLTNNVVTTQQHPIAFVLGGQPGAGKSSLIELAKRETKDNIMIINGDDFRFQHPDFNYIYKTYGDDFVTHTAKFSGETVECAIERAIASKLNIVVEGTFRNAATPLQTLKKLKEAGYRTEVMIKTTSSALSWESTNERYNKDKEAGNIARKVDKNHHDIVTDLLAENASKVFASNLADKFSVYSREKMIFSSQAATNDDIATLIQNEISGNTQEE
ncbi:zeta toxin [Escherichia coli]|uniref:zeta toxin family protein n=1 Tax=Escherichia sp. MOD1-EC7003 TaxID=2093900 RepID=UPI000CF79B74|nr:zeta toxin family protein [Escherichia sp. MOD1-EC7003]EGO8359762.1 zeta toxin [Escherichia coli]EGO8376725.1 zeta toxin [Escherichia coli]